LQLLNEDEQARLCVVIEELVANLYDHGGLSDQDEVELTLTRDPAGVRVSLVDPGAPFDPWSARSKSARPDRGGGVGIDIVKAWALYTGYEASKGANRLEFLLPIRWAS
jgi:anti-sigma regulatory factor (Ser/Thr protein kinase)